MSVFQRTKTKTLSDKVDFSFIFNVFFIIVIDLLIDLSNQPSKVECLRHNHVKIHDYTSFYQDDIANYKDDSIIEEDDSIAHIVPKGIFSTTSSPLEVFESYFVDREKLLERSSDEMPSPVEPNKKTRTHHKHRHRKKKPKEHSNQSFESFFNNLAENEPTSNIEEYNGFLYEDDLKDYSETGKLESKDSAEENSLKDFEDFLKDVKTKDSIRQEENDVVRQHINKTKHAYHNHVNLHNHKHGKHAEHHVPHEFKMMDFVDPTVQELIMLTPGLPFVDIPWPVKKEAVVEGDVLLGGLMMVHSREDGVTCGPIMPQGGIQALEAMLYTLDIFNRRLKLVPNVTIGAHILDDCDKDTYGLEMAVDFIKG